MSDNEAEQGLLRRGYYIQNNSKPYSSNYYALTKNHIKNFGIYNLNEQEKQFACTVSASSCSKIERALHKAFAPNRVHACREFFKISPDQAIAILYLFDHKQEITEEVNREIDNDLTGEDKASRENLKRQKRPNLNFIEMGIPVGSIITFGNESDANQASVCSDKKVSYLSEEYSLTALTQKLKNIDRPIAPTPYWYFNGKSLIDIYEETYPFAED